VSTGKIPKSAPKNEEENMSSNMVVRKIGRVILFPLKLAVFPKKLRVLRSMAAVVACTGFGFVTPPVFGQVEVGFMGGVTRDSVSGKPVADVQVIAHNLRKGAEHAAFTSADGTFTLTNLEPGAYELAVTKKGFNNSSAQVEVAASQTARVDFLLQVASAEGRTVEKADNSQLTEREKQLLDRIDRLEGRLAAIEAKDTSTVQTAKAAPGAVPTVPPTGSPVPAAPSIPVALQAPDPAPAVDNFTPFAFGDFTWLNGTSRNKDVVLDTKFFTPEVRFDTHFMTDFNQPKDHTIGGATESFRSGEFQLEQVSVGGDFHWQNVRGRILTMDGLFATTTPRNDASAGLGQWDVRGAYKYVSEAYGGYHFDVNHGLNVDAGIFVSYIGLFSYYNFDNWTYQPSYVSSNTPWFFNGLRVQWFPTNKLKIEPWIINGWQSYNRPNGHHGFGGQILYRPYEWLSLVSNNYGNGTDTLGNPARVRLHTDDSVEVRYYNRPEETSGISKMAFSFTGDLGCEYGGGVTCHGGKGGPKQAFLGWMLYNRFWFAKDKYALTLGGGQMNNPGRYLTLLPPINGADAISGSPYFTANPGDKSHMWDSTVNLQYMPRQYITWWAEVGYRHSDVPYFTGRGGITPPGGNTGSPSQYVCAAGGSAGTSNLSAAEAACGGGLSSVWFPDLRRSQATISVGLMVKF
jgi:Putative beta-barrel porin-2, OmpL-like. bbp2/Carboxypeptidase regulatory-like domain